MALALIALSACSRDGRLTVATEPAGATIILNDLAQGTTPSTLTLKPGSYRLRLALAGHEDAAQDVLVAVGATASVFVALKPTAVPPPTGALSLDSDPAGATVTIDGLRQDQPTPLLVSGLTSGTHEVDMSLAGHWSASTRLVVAADSTVSARITLRRRVTTGDLVVTSRPAGAAISLNGVPSALVTPAVFTGLVPSQYVVAVSLPGYFTARATLAVAADSVRTFAPDLELIPTFGDLFVEAIPAGAAITLDGQATGLAAPALFTHLLAGAHAVSLSHARFESRASQVTLTEGTVTTVGIRLDPAPLNEFLGSVHSAGKYNFTAKDFLNEGADRLLEFGTKVIKIWFCRMDSSYSFNSAWPPEYTLDSFEELAELPYVQDLFAKPFKVFVLEALHPQRSHNYWAYGMTPEQIAVEKNDFYLFARYLLTKYRNTGKTFILQNWEGDGALGMTWNWDDLVPDAASMQNMVLWLNARQDGVEQARQEVGMEGVAVYNAAEVNLVRRAMEGTPQQRIGCVNNVIPYTHCDLYSYSAYDGMLGDEPGLFAAALAYLKDKAPDSALFGADNLYIGEFGYPENDPGFTAEDQYEHNRKAVETALAFGVRHMLYWQLYCNEIKTWSPIPVTDPETMRGFWLVRPDGTESPFLDWFRSVMN